MKCFKNPKVAIISVIGVISVVLVCTLSIFDTTTTSLNIGQSNNIGDSSMSIGDSKLPFKKSKVEATLKKHNINGYNSSGLINYTIIDNIIDVPYIYQAIKYPTGCESVSATSVLQYYGLDISVDTFIDEYLPKAELEIIGYDYNDDKILSGMHPNEYFIGNPKSYSGLGCYQDTIASTIKAILKDYNLEEDFKVTSYDNLSINDIQSYLDNDIPVIVWATQNLVPTQEGLHWYLGDTDTIFQYMKNEHCMVAIGYNDNYIYFNDTLVGRVAYPKSLLEERYIQMGSRSVVVECIG